MKVGYIVVGGGSVGLASLYYNYYGVGNRCRGGSGGNGGAIAYSSYANSNLTLLQNNTYTIKVGSGATYTNTNIEMVTVLAGRYFYYMNTITSSGADSYISLSTTKIINAKGGIHPYTNYNTQFKTTNTASATGGTYNFNGGNGSDGGTSGFIATTYNKGGFGCLVDISNEIYTYGYSYYGGGGGGGIGQDHLGDSAGPGGNGRIDVNNKAISLGCNDQNDGRGGINNTSGSDGISNKGGGGGGGGAGGADDSGNVYKGGNGGSGVVIIYFPTPT